MCVRCWRGADRELIVPGARHGFGSAGPYFQQRMWDFFADHLLGDRQTAADIYEKNGKNYR